jgi:iron complex outermembrane recepter protein
MKFQRKKIAVAVAMFAGGALSAFLTVPAVAQTPTTTPAGQPIRVDVTGTNIRRVDSETASPVQVITAEDMSRSGYTTINEVLRDITANNQGLLSNAFSGAFAGGASGVALRGLTVGATLVLIDGLRMVTYPLPDDGQRSFVDISSIPFSAVERIEVLLDGASAIYGSDAIGGVVNIILKKNYKGYQLTADGGAPFASGGGGNVHASITGGWGSDSLNAYAVLEYRKQQAISFQSRQDKDWANMNWQPYGGIDLRPGARSPLVTNPTLQTPYLQRPGSSSTDPTAFAFLNSGCDFQGRQNNQCLFDNTWDNVAPETQNVNVIGRVNWQINNDWAASLTGSWFQSEGQQTRRQFVVPAGSAAPNIAYGPGQGPTLVNGISSFLVPATYPGNTLGVPAIVRAYVPDISNQLLEFDTQTTRIVADVNGTYAGWDMRLSAGYQYASTDKTNNGFVNYNALLAALRDPVNPLNLNGGNPASVVNTYGAPVNAKYTNEYNFIQFTTTKDLMKLDGGMLGLALGASYYYQKLNADNPAQCKDGSVAGLNCFYSVGDQANTAAYAEINAPVLKNLELGAAVRYDYYDTYGGQWTPKFSAKWTPIKEVGIRGTWGKGFRAPNINEAGDSGLAFSAQGTRDPANCPVSNADGSPNLTSPQNVPFYCSFNVGFLQSSTPNLEPEKSTNWTLGLILEPIANWSTTVDYYSIDLTNQIIAASSLPGFDPIPGAVRGPQESVTFGDGRQGLSPAGIIAYVPEGYVNAQSTKVTGIDLQSTWTFALPDNSRMKLAAQWSHIISYDLEVGGQTYNVAGTHGPAVVSGNTGTPRDRVQLTGQWMKGPFTGTLIGNYVSGYSMDDPSSGITDCDTMAAYGNPFRWPSGGVPEQFCSVDSFWYVNLNLQWQFNKQTMVQLSINNLFNQQAPVDVGGYAGTGDNRNTSRGAPYNPSLHMPGVIGTSWMLGFTYTF